MKKIFFLLGFLLSCQTPEQRRSTNQQRADLAPKFMVVSPDQKSALKSRRILERGGNAADAAIFLTSFLEENPTGIFLYYQKSSDQVLSLELNQDTLYSFYQRFASKKISWKDLTANDQIPKMEPSSSWVSPLVFNYREMKIATTRNRGGENLQAMLVALAKFNYSTLGLDTYKGVHLKSEIIKRVMNHQSMESFDFFIPWRFNSHNTEVKPREEKKLSFALTDVEGNTILGVLSRDASSFAPAMVFNKDNLFVVTSGSSDQVIFQVITNIIDFKMGLEAAISAPRIFAYENSNQLFLESGGFEKSLVQELRDRKYSLRWSDPLSLGSVEGLIFNRDENFILGVADPRSKGSAQGL